MSDDLLERATRALRETSAEPQPRSGLTRARILDSAQKRHAPRGVIVRWLIGISAVLAASTALARVAEHWPELRELLAPAATEPANSAPKPTRRAQPKAATPVSPALQPMAAADGAAVAPGSGPQASGSELGERAAANTPVEQTLRPRRARDPAPRRPRSTTPTPATSPATTSAALPAAAPASEAAPHAESAELSLFRRAQQLHLAHDPGAVAAWDAYLRIAGQGVLAPEARYNRALALVRQGRIAEARHALGMFARGELGNYRRGEAQRLLDALADQPDRR
jgi:hypothetical protein